MPFHLVTRARSLPLFIVATLLLGACTTAAPPTNVSSAANVPVAAAAPAAAPSPKAAAPSRPADAALRTRVEAELPAYMETLKTLVAMESGSRDLEGLAKLADHLANRLRAAGMAPPGYGASSNQGFDPAHSRPCRSSW